MAAATTSLATFQPPPGLPATQALAHAVHHIGKIAKQNETLKRSNNALETQVAEKETQWGETAKAVYVNALDFVLHHTASGGIGYVNGHWSRGTGKDHATAWGWPVDAAVSGTAHILGLVAGALMTDDVGKQIARSLHTIGKATGGAVAYRLGFERGAQEATPGPSPVAQANGVKGGTVYAAPAPHK